MKTNEEVNKMKASTEIKSKSMKSNTDLQSLIVEQLRDADRFDMPENSALIASHEAGGPINHHSIFHFDNQDTKSPEDPAVFLRMVINPKVLIHNCECHKLAAICFFEWTQDGKYKQVPPIEGLPDLQYVIFGMVEELSVDD